MLHNFVLDKFDRMVTTFLYLLNLTFENYMYFDWVPNHMYNILQKMSKFE